VTGTAALLPVFISIAGCRGVGGRLCRLTRETKGPQDFVSIADREVESLIRTGLAPRLRYGYGCRSPGSTPRAAAEPSGRPLYSAEREPSSQKTLPLERVRFEPSVLRDATDVSKTASCRLFLISRNGKVAIETPRQARTPAFSAVPKVQSGFLQRRVARTPKPGRLTIKARALAFLRQGPPLQLSMR
jgi:hypothetical protein